MAFLFTQFVFPLKEKISISDSKEIYLDNPRTQEEIDLIVEVIKSVQGENSPAWLFTPIDHMSLESSVDNFFENFIKGNENEEYYLNYIQNEDVKITLSKMFIICRYKDENYDLTSNMQKYYDEISDIYTDSRINTLGYCHFFSLLFGCNLILDEALKDYYFYTTSPSIALNLDTWKTYILMNKSDKNLAGFNQMYPFFKLFDSYVEKEIISIAKKVNSPDLNQERIQYIGNILFTNSKSKDHKLLLLSLISLIELMLTHNPDFNRYNVEDSISKQFTLKSSIVVYQRDKSTNLEDLKKKFKQLYNIRSKIAHGDYTSLHKELKKINSKVHESVVYNLLINESYYYVKKIIESYLDDPKYIDFLKEN